MATKLWHAMLAAHPKERKDMRLNEAINAVIEDLSLPVMGSTKLDGIRCTVQGGKLYSRSGKLLPNLEMQDKWGFKELNELDGEITVGVPWAADVFQKTQSAVMSIKGSAAGAVFRVFDGHFSTLEFHLRHKAAAKIVARYSASDVVLVEHRWLKTVPEIFQFENECVEHGYEGICLRDPYGAYKQGRSTINEEGLVAIKRFVDAEAVILSSFEQQTNNNVKETNELGRSKRSTHKANMVGNGTLGGFTVRLLGRGGKPVGNEFNVGTGVGLTNAKRDELWARRKTLPKKIIKIKYQMVGTVDAPRIPIFLGWRDRRDM